MADFHGPYQQDPWDYIVEISFPETSGQTILDFVNNRYLVKGKFQDREHVIDHPEYRTAAGLDLISNRDIETDAIRGLNDDRTARIINGHPDFLDPDPNNRDAHERGAFDQFMRFYDGRILVIEFDIQNNALEALVQAVATDRQGLYFVNDGEGGPPLWQWDGSDYFSQPIVLAWNGGTQVAGFHTSYQSSKHFAITQNFVKRADSGSIFVDPLNDAENPALCVYMGTFWKGPFYIEGRSDPPPNYPPFKWTEHTYEPQSPTAMGWPECGGTTQTNCWYGTPTSGSGSSVPTGNETEAASAPGPLSPPTQMWCVKTTAEHSAEPFVEVTMKMSAYDSEEVYTNAETRMVAGTFNESDDWFYGAVQAENGVEIVTGINRIAIYADGDEIKMSVNGSEPQVVSSSRPFGGWSPNFEGPPNTKFQGKEYYHFEELVDFSMGSVSEGNWHNFAQFGGQYGHSGRIRFAAIYKFKNVQERASKAAMVKRFSKITSSSGWWTNNKWTGYSAT